MNKVTKQHEKFKAYWEELGKPGIEIGNDGDWCPLPFPKFDSTFVNNHYRIKGDPHWRLRRRWIDSDKTLPIEWFNEDLGDHGEWTPTNGRPVWFENIEYREAQQQNKEDYLKITGNSPIANWLWEENQKNLKDKTVTMYSVNDEEYRHTTIQEAVEDIMCFWEGPGIYTIYESEFEKPKGSYFLSANFIVDEMIERSGDECGESSEYWLDGISQSTMDDLGAVVHTALDKFLDAKNLQPNFYVEASDSRAIHVRIINENCWGVIE